MKNTLNILLFFQLILSLPSEAREEWVASHITFTPWVSTSEHCEEWSPSAESTLVNQVIRQQSYCKIFSNRLRQIFEKNKLTGETRLKDSIEEERFKREVKWRTVPGEKDIIVAKGALIEWSDWLLLGKAEACFQHQGFGEHLKLNQLAISLIQCKQQEFRKKQVFDLYLSGKKTATTPPETEEKRIRTVYYTLAQRGEKDAFLPPKKEVSPWRTVSITCNEVKSRKVAAKQTPGNALLTISEECHDTKVREEYTVKESLSGQKEQTPLGTTEEKFSFTRWRFVPGEKDVPISEKWELLPGYKITSENEMCARSSVSAEFVPMGTVFFQYRQCEGVLTGKEARVISYTSGKNAIEEEREVIRNVSLNVIETQVGNYDNFIANIGAEKKLPWRSLSDERCDIYLPLSQSMPRGLKFTQYAQCVQDGVHDVVQTQRWLSGEREVALPSISRRREFILTRESYGEASMAFSSTQLSLSNSNKKTNFFFNQMWKPKNISVSYESETELSGANIVLISPNGERLYLPTIRLRSGNFYFSLDEHQASALGEWTVEKIEDSQIDSNILIQVHFKDN